MERNYPHKEWLRHLSQYRKAKAFLPLLTMMKETMTEDFLDIFSLAFLATHIDTYGLSHPKRESIKFHCLGKVFHLEGDFISSSNYLTCFLIKIAFCAFIPKQHTMIGLRAVFLFSASMREPFFSGTVELRVPLFCTTSE